MPGKVGVLTLFVLLFSWMQAGAQRGDETISLGNQTLRLGMPKQLVLDRLSTGGYLVDCDKVMKGVCLVFRKNDPPSEPRANVNFENDRVASVIKYWGPADQQKGVEFAKAVYGAIAGLVGEGKTNCVISVGQNQEPRFEARTAFIECGKRRIDITIRSHESWNYAEVNEHLKDPSSRQRD